MNHTIKKIGIIVAIPIFLIFILSALLYLPVVQNKAKEIAVRYATKATGMNIEVDKIRLSFPLDLAISGVEVTNASTDTLLAVEKLIVRIKMLPLIKKEVVLDELTLQRAQINSDTLLSDLRVKGYVEKLYIQAHSIDLVDEKAIINKVTLDNSHLSLVMDSTSTPKDSTSTPMRWKIVVDNAAISQLNAEIELPEDSIPWRGSVENATLIGGMIDLGKTYYAAKHFDLINGSVDYDNLVGISDLNIDMDSLLSEGVDAKILLNKLSLKEVRGWEITEMHGALRMDSTQLWVDDMQIRTPYSSILFNAKGASNALKPGKNGLLDASFNASIGKEDLLPILADSQQVDFKKNFPVKPLSLRAAVSGNMDRLQLIGADAVLPSAFEIHLSGLINQMSDSIARSGNIQLKGKGENLNFMLAFLNDSLQSKLSIPKGIKVDGTANFAEGNYNTALNLREGTGLISLVADYNTINKAYDASLKIDSFLVSHFMPGDSIHYVTAGITAKGKGIDLYTPSTSFSIAGDIQSLVYGGLAVSGITMKGNLENHLFSIHLNSSYTPVNFTAQLTGRITQREVEGKLNISGKHIDFHTLGIVNKPFATRFDLAATASSNWNEKFALAVNILNWDVIGEHQTSTLKPLALVGSGSSDSLTVEVLAGDLKIELLSDKSILTVKKQLDNLSAAFAKELKETRQILSLYEMKPYLPDLTLNIEAGNDNPLTRIMEHHDLSFNHLVIGGSSSPLTGLNTNAQILSFKIDTLVLDTMYLTLRQDSNALIVNGGIINGVQNKQHVFAASLTGEIALDHINTLFNFKDGTGNVGLNLGVNAQTNKDGLILRLYPNDPIIAFKNFRLNPNNYIFLSKKEPIRADVALSEANGSEFILRSTTDTTENSDKLALILKRFEIAQVVKLFPYLPNIGGILGAEGSYQKQDSLYHLTLSAAIDSLSYETKPLGNIALQGSYLPDTDKNHHLDARLFHNNLEVLTAKGDYYTATNGDSLLSNITLQDFPLSIANAFIPEDMASIKGKIEGELRLEGKTSSPMANGYLLFDSTSVYIMAAGSKLSIENKEIKVLNNQLQFDALKIFSAGTNPFVIDGYINMSEPSHMTANLQLSANNMELLNAKQNKLSLLYGKMYINLNTTIKGPIESLLMRGNLELLGGTDVSYVLKDSPLAVQDRLSGLVTFVNFADTAAIVQDETRPLQIGGMDVLLTINIDQAVRANIDLTEDQSSRIALEGGGNLSFQYTPLGEMILNGRYTLNGGTIKYMLPVVGAKNFSVQNGSYVQWLGNVFDPQLNITAIERVRTSVAINNQPAQMVNFDASIAIKNSLEDLSLVFDLTAPENLAVQNQLTATSAEERSKQAITMLVTGTYIAEGSSSKGGIDMGNALNSFLQNEINNLAGSALKGVDLSFGVENADPNSNGGIGGAMDYSFRFSKRFYNDRIRFIIGGKISTGTPEEGTQSFLDNVTLEYRLDNSGTRYVQLFYDTNYESILEGEVTETGAGIVLRKKMRKMKELFIFKSKKNNTKKEVK